MQSKINSLVATGGTLLVAGFVWWIARVQNHLDNVPNDMSRLQAVETLSSETSDRTKRLESAFDNMRADQMSFYIWSAFKAGDVKEAREWQEKLKELLREVRE